MLCSTKPVMYDIFLCRGIATLSDYKEKPAPPTGQDAEQFFAGGSEHSGQMIEGPPRKKQTSENIAKEVFEAAKQLGCNFV